jgi:MFS family permease
MVMKKGGAHAYFIWAIGSLFYLYEYFVRVVPSVMEGDLELAFGANAAQIATAVGMYLMAYSPMQLVVGPLFDVFGTRKLLVPASFILTLSCLLPLVPSDHLVYFGLGRFLMGFSSAFGFVGVMYLCTIWFPAKRLAMLSGLTTALGMLGAITAQTCLSSLNAQLGWHSTWYLSAAFGIPVTCLLMFCIPKHPDWLPKPRGKHIWISCKNNLKQVFKNKQTWLIGFLSSALFMPLAVFADFWAIPYFVNVSHFTGGQAVKLTALLYLGWTLGAPLVGWLSDRFQTRKIPLFVSGLLSSFVFTWIICIPTASFATIAFLLFVLGLCSSGQVVGFIACVELNTKQASGSSIAVINMIVMWLCGFVQTLTGYLIDLFKPCCNLQQTYQLSLCVVTLSLVLGTVLFGLFAKEGSQAK